MKPHICQITRGPAATSPTRKHNRRICRKPSPGMIACKAEGGDPVAFSASLYGWTAKCQSGS